MTAPSTASMDASTAAGLDARVVARRGGFTLDIALQVPARQVVALMGPSGAGKSTLLGVLAGLAPFDAGQVRLLGRVLDAEPARRMPPAARGVVLLSQDPRLFPHLSAHDNIAFGLRVRGVSRAAADHGASRWLRQVGLGDLSSLRPAQLSGGQQQRVALARALATRPAALLLDEPLTSLDTETAGDLRALLHRQLAATGTTALVATHDAVDAVALASTLVVLEDGQVTQTGPVREVLSHPSTRFAAAVAGLNRVEGVVVAPGIWRAGGLTLAYPDGDERRAAGGATGDSGAPHGAARDSGGPRDAAGEGSGAGAEASRRHPSSVAAVFRPGDVRLVPATRPGPGEWTARIVRLEQTPAGVRLRTAEPDVAVDVSPEQATGLAAGDTVALRIDPAHVRFAPAGVGEGS